VLPITGQSRPVLICSSLKPNCAAAAAETWVGLVEDGVLVILASCRLAEHGLARRNNVVEIARVAGKALPMLGILGLARRQNPVYLLRKNRLIR